MVRTLLRRCTATTGDGGPCDATPMRDRIWCFWHHPDHQKDAAEGRRLGGIRRKREGMVAGAYEFQDCALSTTSGGSSSSRRWMRWAWTTASHGSAALALVAVKLL